MMNKSTMKKIAGAALASVMAMSLAVPAFAVDDPTPVKPLAETTESSFAVELEGMVYVPTIRVQVSESGSVYVNPSKSEVAGKMVKALDGTTDLDYSFSDYGVVSTPILIRSDTDKALKVSATATASVPKTSGIKITDTTSLTTDTEKQINMVLTGSKTTALGNSSNLVTTPADPSATPPTAAVPGLTEDDLDSSGAKFKASDDGKSAAIATAAEVAAIDAATLNTDASTGKVTTAIPQYGVVVVTGAASGKSATAWTESDVVNVSVALTFALA